jgi:aryl-alcohol dehydrogenase-like predicted oxidoreductase
MSLINKLAIGTAQFGLDYGISNKEGKTSGNEIKKILNYAWGKGIRVLDTARVYGNSEQSIATNTNLQFKIISKFPAISSHGILNQILNESLIALNVSNLYGYIAHDANNLIENEYIWNELLVLKEKRIVEKIGYSVYSPDQMQSLLDIGMKPDIIQFPYSFIDKRFEPYFQQLKALDIEINVRSVFLQGLLLMESNSLSSFFNPVKSILDLLNEKIENTHLPLLLLRWAIEKPEINYLIFGINNIKQLQENILGLDEVNTDLLKDIEIPKLPDSILLPYKWPK